MALDFSNYKVPKSRPLPVILLLDVSGSMQGTKIDSLYEATVDMIDSFVNEEIKETVINIAIITFGGEVNLHTEFTPVKDLQAKGITKFHATGGTPLGVALRMAKDMINDKSIMPSNSYIPAVVVASDGEPNDDWREPLNDFLNGDRTSKCQKFAVAIGADADRNVLEMYTGTAENVFFAEEADEIADNFKKVTMSVVVRSKSVNPNDFSNQVAPNQNDNDDDDNY